MARLKKRKDGRYQRKVTLSNGKQKFVCDMFLNNYLCYNMEVLAEKKPIEEQVDCNIDINIFC